MEVKSLECQLASMQLNRYLAGTPLSDEAMHALESHLASCAVCQTELREKQAATAKIETGNAPTHAVVQTEEKEEEKPQGRPLVTMTPFKKKVLDKLPNGSRTFILSTVLALILIAMSTLAKNPGLVFGDRADKGLPDSAPKTNLDQAAIDAERKRFAVNETPSGTPSGPDLTNSPAPKTVLAAEVNAPAETKPETEPSKAEVKTQTQPAAAQPTAPKPTPAKPVVHPSTRRTSTRTKARVHAPVRRSTSKPKTTARKPKSGIVVYDSHGNRIN